jgi:integrase
MASASFQTSNEMSIYKRGRYYWYSFWFRGERIQCGTKSTSSRVASKLEALHKVCLIDGKQPPTPAKEVPTFSEFSERYMEFSKANKRSYGIEKCYVRAILKPHFGEHRLDQITAMLAEQFKQKRLKDGLKKSSINREVGLLKSMLSKAVEWELVDRNHAQECKLFKLDDERQPIRVLSQDEESKLLTTCEGTELKRRAPLLKPIILIALYTGLRRGEILRLRWADIDFESDVLTVQRAKTPAGQGRHVNINSRLREALLALKQKAKSEWLFPSPNRFQRQTESERHLMDVKKAFHRAVKLAGILHITFHQLRHTFCTRLADAGVPLPVIQDLAGHASIIMTRRYTHPGNELKQQAVELLLAEPNRPEIATRSATEESNKAEQPAKSTGRVIQFRRVVGSTSAGGRI